MLQSIFFNSSWMGMVKNLQMHLRLDQLKIIGVSSKWKSMKEIGRLKPEII